MTEGYLVKRFKEKGIKDTLVTSSGTGAVPGLKPTEETVKVMKEDGIDVSGYISSNLSKTHIESADIILVMTPAHKNKILSIVPKTKDKIYLLREFSSEKNRKGSSIGDPIGRSYEFYKEIFEIIKNSIEGFLKWLNE